MRGAARHTAVLLLASGLIGCNAALSPQAQQLLDSGQRAYEQGNDVGAVGSMDAFLRDNASSRRADEAYYVRGLAKYRMGHRTGAERDLAEALRHTRHERIRLGAIVALGDLAYERGDLTRADAMYRDALPRTELGKPPADHVHYRLGCVLQRQGRWQDADVHFDRVMYAFEGTELAKRAARHARCRAWSVQAGAFQQKALADKAAEVLRNAGRAAEVCAESRDGELWFLLLVGRYATFQEAEAALPGVRRHHADAFIATVR